MSTSSAHRPISIEALSFTLGDPARWSILRELGKGEPRMVSELAHVAGKSPQAASKHLIAMKDLGIVVLVRRLYQIAPEVKIDPVARTMDFGHALLRFD